MVPMEHEDQFDLTLESILDEYRGFDPEAPEATPLPEAAFASKIAEAELIDAGPEELLTPEELVALQTPEPKEIDFLLEDLEPETEQADAFAAREAEIDPGDLEEILAGLRAENPDELLSALQDAEPEDAALYDPDDDVRAYYPHGQEPEEAFYPDEPDFSYEPEPESGPLARLKGLARRFAEIVAPEEDEPEDAPPTGAEEIRQLEAEEAPAADAPLIDPEQTTQVFQAVTETFGEEDLSVELPQDAEFWAQVLAEEEAYYASTHAAEPAQDDDPGDEFDEAFDEDAAFDEDDEDEYEEIERRSFQDTVIRPVVERLAAVSVRLRERREERREMDAAEEALGPEPTARLAQRYYASKEGALRSRSRLALLVSLVLLYLSSGLPVFGLLRNSPRVMAMMCVLLQLIVMLIGLDVLTVGLTTFKHRRPGMESLVLLGCVFSLIDGVLCAVFNSLERGMPYCVVSALAVTFLIYSAYCRARGCGVTFYALNKSNSPAVFTAGTNEYYEGITLSKTRRSTEGFIHRTEEPGPDAVTFAVLTPYLIALGAILSLLATALSGSVKNAGHIFAAIFSAAAPLVAIIIYTAPFRRLATFLQPKGMAIAGWSGASDIGRGKRFVVTDTDLFSERAVTLREPEFIPGMSEAKAVAYAASLVKASGCCLAPAFAELLEGYNYPTFPVVDFQCDSAGGMSGFIHDELVLLGTSEFLRLKEIVTASPEVEQLTTLYVAINHELCAKFPVEYHAQKNIENALHYLLRSSEKPVFAVRDPNIAPRMLKQKFHAQTDGFDFPVIPARYALSDPELGIDDPICGIITRTGLAPLLTITKTGKQLCRYVRGGLTMSLLVLALGMLVMFWLCSVGLFATGSAFHLAVYELVAALIVPIINHFVRQ